MSSYVDDRLSKEIPTHLFQFKETVFGSVTVVQLMYDIAAFAGGWFLWSQHLPLPLRIALVACYAVLALVVIHLKIAGYSVIDLLLLRVRAFATPSETVWAPPAAARLLAATRTRALPPSVQETWIPLRELGPGYLGFADKPAVKGKPGPTSRYCIVMEVSGRNLQLLPEDERVRVYQEFERFLAGLQFPLQFHTSTEPINVYQYPPLLAQEQQVRALQATAPRLARLRAANLKFQRTRIGNSLRTRHFVVVSAGVAEQALRTPEGKTRPGYQVLFGYGRLWGRRKEDSTNEEVLRQLRIRAEVVYKGLARLDLHIEPLAGAELLHFCATCLAPGTLVTRSLALANELAPFQVGRVPDGRANGHAPPAAQKGVSA
jgi:hypothetical protein